MKSLNFGIARENNEVGPDMYLKSPNRQYYSRQHKNKSHKKKCHKLPAKTSQELQSNKIKRALITYVEVQYKL